MNIVESLRAAALDRNCINPSTQQEAADTIEKLLTIIDGVLKKLDERIARIEAKR